MKKYSFLIAGLLFLCSCNVTVKHNNEEEQKEAPAAEAGAPQSEKIAKAKDPVCGMDMESGWTEFTASGTDTTWFCSPHCKETYDKDPGKYQHKQGEAGKS